MSLNPLMIYLIIHVYRVKKKLFSVCRFVLFPLGYWCGVKKKKSNSVKVGDPVLEGLYKKNGLVNRNNLEVMYM